MNTIGSPAFEGDAPFLETDPPHWAARGLSSVLIVLFVTALVVATVVRVPETVSGSFTVVPELGADPVRAAREGTVAAVHAVEGQTLAKGATLFVIRSQAVGDLTAEMRGLEMQQSGAEQRASNARAEYESQRRADELELRRLEARLASLDRTTALKRKQLAVARDIADRSKRGAQQGVVVGFDADKLVLDADQLDAELEAAAADHEDTRMTLAKLRQDTLTRGVQHRELLRSLDQEREIARMRLESMRGQVSANGGDLIVASPCDGTVVRLMVSTPGAVVQAGDALGEVACAGQPLQVEMALGQQAVPRVKPGQSAKLLYDAFPYQRFGVRFGQVRWVGPASAGGAAPSGTAAANESGFRAFIDPADSAIVVAGERRPLLVGMRGRARVVIGRRSLISFAFEPIRALRENLTGAPAQKPAERPPS